MTRETAGQVSSHKTLRTPERRKDQNILYRARRATRTIFYLVPASHSLQRRFPTPGAFHLPTGAPLQGHRGSGSDTATQSHAESKRQHHDLNSGLLTFNRMALQKGFKRAFIWGSGNLAPGPAFGSLLSDLSEVTSSPGCCFLRHKVGTATTLVRLL